MNLTVGYIPYLNMVPFHQDFGPNTLRDGDHTIRFQKYSPRSLGLAAEAGQVDAGAMSLVDTFRLSDRFEYLGDFGIGVKRAAGSVLLFSKGPLSELQGMCSVTDETSTSFQLLKVLLEMRYKRTGVSFGRVASSLMFDGTSEALLLIGDEALRARRYGIKGLPVITDLATEWYTWQGNPFVFARWVIRKNLPSEVKFLLYTYLDNALKRSILILSKLAEYHASKSGLSASELECYWDGFLFRLTADHMRSIETFKEFSETLCLTA